MPNPVLVCSTTYGGCGHVDTGDKWSLPTEDSIELDFVACPRCGEDHTFQLTKDNLAHLVCDENMERAVDLLRENGYLPKP